MFDQPKLVKLRGETKRLMPFVETGVIMLRLKFNLFDRKQHYAKQTAFSELYRHSRQHGSGFNASAALYRCFFK